MGRILNIAIILLIVTWILGMVFSAIFGLLIHVLLLFAVIAIGMRIALWFKRPKKDRPRTDSPRTTVP